MDATSYDDRSRRGRQPCGRRATAIASIASSGATFPASRSRVTPMASIRRMLCSGVEPAASRRTCASSAVLTRSTSAPSCTTSTSRYSDSRSINDRSRTSRWARVARRFCSSSSWRTLPPTLRAQVRQLEEEQKRRATRAQRDVLDRSLIDLLSLYRDVLVVQLGADVDLVNTAEEAEVRRLAAGSTPEQSIRRMDAIGVTRERLAGNVAPLLAMEAMAVALRPQG